MGRKPKEGCTPIITCVLEASTCLPHRMKTEGAERANLSSQILKMSLDYQFVTPLTSMTIRGLTDQDGLEPTIDKTPEGTGIGVCGQEGHAPKSSWDLILFFFLFFRFSAFR